MQPTIINAATEFHYAFHQYPPPPPSSDDHHDHEYHQFGLSQNDSPTFIISGRFPAANIPNNYNLQNNYMSPPDPTQAAGFNKAQGVPPISCLSSNSTSDEAEDEQQLSNIIINERKQRRMISNRESARRSRMRKQKQLDELWSQVVSLRSENHQLIDKLNHASEYNEKVVEENAQLKEEASELRQMLIDMKFMNSPTCPSNFGDFPAADDTTTNYLVLEHNYIYS